MFLRYTKYLVNHNVIISYDNVQMKELVYLMQPFKYVSLAFENTINRFYLLIQVLS